MLLIVSVPGVEKGKNSVLCTELLDLLSVVFDFCFELKFGYRGFVDFGQGIVLDVNSLVQFPLFYLELLNASTASD